MLGVWLDYSQGRPTGAQLKAAGIVGVMRYVGLATSLPAKRLTAAELAGLTAHGLIVLGAVESTTTRSNAGRTQGVADGNAALADPVTKTLPVLFATNDQSTWSQANVDYVAGFQSVVGKVRTGVYGFGAFLAACQKAGLGSVYWQAGPAPSRTGTSSFVHFWQRNGTAGTAADGPATPTTQIVGGVTCDPNNQLKALEVPDVELTDSFTYPSRVTGANATTTVQKALGAAQDLFDQLTKGNSNGPAGWWVNSFLTPDHTALGELSTQLDTLATNVQAALNSMAAAIAEIKAAQTPAGTLSGEATVTVQLIPGS